MLLMSIHQLFLKAYLCLAHYSSLLPNPCNQNELLSRTLLVIGIGDSDIGVCYIFLFQVLARLEFIKAACAGCRDLQLV